MSKVRTINAVAILLLSLVAVGVCVHLPEFRGRLSAEPTESQDLTSRGHATVYLADPKRDLGHTTIRKKWGLVFQVQNTGTRRLVLNELDPHCACDDRIRRTIVVPPGKIASVGLTLDTRFTSGPTEVSMSLITNDPAHPRVNLVARAWVDAADVSGHSTADDDTDLSVLIRQ